MKQPAAARGELWMADVAGDKKRPVLILTRDPLGEILHSVICAPITSTIRGLSTEVAFGKAEGLGAESVANFDNIFLLPRARLIRKLGVASGAQMIAACEAVAIATGCI